MKKRLVKSFLSKAGISCTKISNKKNINLMASYKKLFVYHSQHHLKHFEIKLLNNLYIIPPTMKNSFSNKCFDKYLDIFKYNEWSRNQLASILIASKENGGINLSVEDAKILFDADLNGKHVVGIVKYLQTESYAGATKFLSKKLPLISKTGPLCELVVVWAEYFIQEVFFSLWTDDRLTSNLYKRAQLSVEELKFLKDNGFNVDSFEIIANMIKDQGIDKTLRKERFSCIPINIWEKIVNYVNSIIYSLKPRTDINFNCVTTHVHAMLNKLPEAYLESLQRWKEKETYTEEDQRNKLGDFFRKPFLPDHLQAFDDSYDMWTNHFNDLPIPEDKGKELNDLLSSNIAVGRDKKRLYSIIPVVDLSTAGKTYTIFQLANSKPVNEIYKYFYVINCVEGINLFDTFIKKVESRRNSTQKLISILALTIHIAINTLVEKVPQDISPTGFLKFVRGNGDVFLSQLFLELVSKISDMAQLTELNFEYTQKLKNLHQTKVVFSFDEAHLLLGNGKKTVKLNDGKKGNLFHGVYKEICNFNNPVFVGTTFSICKAALNVSKEGRKLMKPVIGCMKPWFLRDVEKVLCHMFNVEDFKANNPNEFSALCFLLSGSPENFAIFHRAVLQKSLEFKGNKLNNLKIGLQEVIKFKEERSNVRINSLLKENYLTVITPLLRLLFHKECIFQEPYTEELDNDMPVSYTQVFIEKTIAHVVSTTVNKKVFSKSLTPKSLITICQSFTKSPLFSMTESEGLKDWCINATTFINGRHQNVVDAWFTELVEEYFKNTFVKLEQNKGPDGMFYLKDVNSEKTMLVTCAMSLISNKTNDKTQLQLSNLIYKIKSKRLKVPTVGWIVVPNMDTTTFRMSFENDLNSLTENGLLKSIVTGRKEIEDCVSHYKNETYHESMQNVWKKFIDTK